MAGNIPIVSGLHDLVYGAPRKVKPAAFDPDRPNHRGYDTRPILAIVDKRTKRHVDIVQLPLPLKGYSRRAEARFRISATAGGYHVDRPMHSAHGLVHYVMQGSSGLWPEGRRDGAPDGMAAIHRVKSLLDTYADGWMYDRPAAEFDLVLFNPDEPTTEEDTCGDSAYIIVPEGSLVDLQRTGGPNNQTWSYTLRLAGIDRFEDAIGPYDPLKEKTQSLFSKVLGAVSAIQAYNFDVMFAKYKDLISPVLRVRAALQDVRRFCEGYARGIDTFLAYNVGLLESVVDDLRGMQNLIAGEEPSADRARTAEDRFGTDGAELRETQALRLRLQRLRDAVVATPGVLTPTLGAQRDRIGPRAGVLGQASPMQAAATPARLSPADRREGRGRAAQPGARLGSRLVTVAAGQTLEDLIPPGFTDADVLQLNPDLIWPFVDGSQEREGAAPEPGDERVAYAGDTIRVPSLVGQEATTSRGDSPGAAQALRAMETEDERVFGRDLFLNKNTRSLELDPATNDFRTIAGLPNLLQRLENLLSIPIGALRHAPQIGAFATDAGHWGTDLQARLNAVAVRDTIRQDPGIATVRRVKCVYENGRMRVSFEADTVTGTALGRLALAV